jgi:hypothetical protein
MRIAIAFGVVSFALLVASLDASAAGPAGIRGTVVKSPITPVCRQEIPCSAPAPGVLVLFLRGGVGVASATTSASGRYRVVLAPGVYVVRAIRRPVIGSSKPRTVRVLPGRFVVANFAIDTGIR